MTIKDVGDEIVVVKEGVGIKTSNTCISARCLGVLVFLGVLSSTQPLGYRFSGQKRCVSLQHKGHF
ncbi:hypothetical protein J6590_063110 [Homalodisca vitripennis]|nr:hypothetical protein J6590_063110 [Homalodisca vitripennis]